MKVKIRRKPGDQVDYSLSVGNTYGTVKDNTHPTNPEVKTSLKRVPRSEATIEAEGGENIVGDFDQDGLLENSKVSGNRHYSGGVPLNVPPESFVFSDTRKLQIKDKDTLKYFGATKPSTPAKLSKKYDLNYYNQVLKDTDSTIDKETAARMIAKNRKSLGEIAMVQEAMKGFPQGIPSFVENEAEVMKYGGRVLKTMQGGGTPLKSPGFVRPSFAETMNRTYLGQAWNWFMDTPSRSVSDPLYSSIPLRFQNTVTDEIIPSAPVIPPGKSKVLYEPTNTPTDSTSSTPVKKMKDIDDFQRGGFTDEPIEGPNGEKYIRRVYGDGARVLLTADGRIVNSKSKEGATPNKPTVTTTETTPQIPTGRPDYSQYRLEELIKNKSDEFILTQTAVNDLSTQSRRDDGTFAPSKDFKYDFEDFKRRHGEFLNSIGYPVDDFIRDIQSGPNSQAAARYFQEKYNEEFKKRYGEVYFAPSKGEPYGTDGQFGVITYSAPGFKMKPNLVPEASTTTPRKPNFDIPAPPAAPPVKDKPVVVNPGFVDQGKDTSDGWWLQDIAAFTGTMLDRVKEYRPKRQQVNLDRVESTLVDPTRQIAAIQEQSARYQDLAMNTSSGQIARSNVLANSGQAAGATADVIAQYENQNANIVNQTDATNVGIANQETMTNTELDAKYITESAVFGQNKDNAMRELNNRRLAAFVNGTTNNMKKRLMDQVLFPNYAIDPITFEMQFQGQKGRSAYEYDPYINPQMGSAGSQDPMTLVKQQAQQAISAKNELMKAGHSKEDAEWALQQFGRSIKPSQTGANDLFNLQNMYNQMF